MALADRVHVAGRYRRAIRLEADLGDGVTPVSWTHLGFRHQS